MSDNIVKRVARIIEPGAFSLDDWYDGTGPDAKPVKLSKLARSRRDYHRSAAMVKAVAILHLASRLTQAELRRALVEDEREGWRNLGFPADDPEVIEAIERKYGFAEHSRDMECGP